MLKLMLKRNVTNVKAAKNAINFTLSNLNLKKKGLFTFNKQIKYWDVKDPEFNQSNRNFKVLGCKTS